MAEGYPGSAEPIRESTVVALWVGLDFANARCENINENRPWHIATSNNSWRRSISTRHAL